MKLNTSLSSAWLALLAVALTVLTAGCQDKSSLQALSSLRLTPETQQLLEQLRAQAVDTTYLFGQHDAVCYGLGWRGDDDRSDCKSVTGSHPAILSFDLGHLELGDSVNLDGVPFSQIRREAIRHYERGGIVTLSWHLDNPLTGGSSWVADSTRETEAQTVASILEGGAQHDKFLGWLDTVAAFLTSLRTDEGVLVPVLFRPWHEHTGSWFWWGQELCTAGQYKSLWLMTVERLEDQGVTNALYAYSPNTVDGELTVERYLERYPGDRLVDVFGFDEYCFAPEGDTAAVAAFAQNLDRHLEVVCQAAKEHDKVATLTETGYEGVKTADWFTRTIAPVAEKHPIAYVLVWRNADNKPGHFYVPYPGHEAASDFAVFRNDPHTRFLSDL